MRTSIPYEHVIICFAPHLTSIHICEYINARGYTYYNVYFVTCANRMYLWDFLLKAHNFERLKKSMNNIWEACLSIKVMLCFMIST